MVNVSSNRSSGPRHAASEISLADAEAWCRRCARSHYENFLVASLFLPRSLRQPFFNVYAFCRTADDLADESTSPEVALGRLNEFQQRLNQAFAGEPHGEIFVALAHTVHQYALPQEPFDQLLSAFRQDQSQTRYDTRDELLAYCRRSAAPVGRILLQLTGCDSPENAKLSDEICTGLQLANFWQDVRRDHSIGRVYLPRETCERFGVTDSDLDQASTPTPLRQAIRWECDLAEQHFRRGLPLADRVPDWFARDVRLFAHGGLAVLEAIRRVDHDVLGRRVVVGKSTQLRLLVRAWLGLI